MKKLYIILLLAIIGMGRVYSQCVNADFSTGDFTNWTGSVGEHTSTGNDYTVETGMVIGTPNAGPYTAGQQTIINVVGTDENTQGLLSVLPPGGGSCCRLGNAQVEASDGASYPQAAQLNYSMHVSSTSNIFTYQYAVVLQNPTYHTAIQEPKFTIYVLDSAGNQIGGNCGEYVVVASSGIPGYNSCPPSSSAYESDSVLWKDWTTVGVDLSPYINHNVIIQFTSFDCTPGGHFGYAYISCYCGTLPLLQQCTAHSDTLTAPAGFAAYSWTSPYWTGSQTTQSVVISNPVNGDTVSCVCTAVTGCEFTFHTILNIQSVKFSVNAIPDTICSGSVATLISHDSTSYPYIYNWSTSQTGDTITVSPSNTTTYIVTATASGGCAASENVVITVNSSTPTIYSDSDVIVCNPSYLFYQWFLNSDSLAGGLYDSIYSPVTFPGSYYAIVTDSNGCQGKSNTIIITITGIDNQFIKNNISVYPNPVTNIVTIESPRDAVIEITNIQGQLVKTLAATGNKTDIDVSSLANGVYVVEVRTNEGVSVEKFVKE